MSLSHSNMNKSPQFSEEANWENFAADFSMYLSLDANGHKLHPQHSLLQVWTYDPIMNCDPNTPTGFMGGIPGPWDPNARQRHDASVQSLRVAIARGTALFLNAMQSDRLRQIVRDMGSIPQSTPYQLLNTLVMARNAVGKDARDNAPYTAAATRANFDHFPPLGDGDNLPQALDTLNQLRTKLLNAGQPIPEPQWFNRLRQIFPIHANLIMILEHNPTQTDIQKVASLRAALLSHSSTQAAQRAISSPAARAVHSTAVHSTATVCNFCKQTGHLARDCTDPESYNMQSKHRDKTRTDKANNKIKTSFDKLPKLKQGNFKNKRRYRQYQQARRLHQQTLANATAAYEQARMASTSTTESSTDESSSSSSDQE